MSDAYILLGGNVGDTAACLRNGRLLLGTECGEVIKQSAIYETAPWGKHDQQNFLNQALLLSTVLSPQQLIRSILEIEERLGRMRVEKYGPRIIDIDILLFNDEVISEPGLTVPHPELQNRRFALVPLLEIADNIIHPVLHKTIGQLLQECPDSLEVSLYK